MFERHGSALVVRGHPASQTNGGLWHRALQGRESSGIASSHRGATSGTAVLVRVLRPTIGGMQKAV